MPGDARTSAESLQEMRADIVKQLRARRAEIEQRLYVSIQEAVPEPIGSQDPAYQVGVRAAITAVVEYCLQGIDGGSQRLGPIPPAAAGQARRAAGMGVGVGTVLRRYVAGHRQFGEFIAEEAERSGLSNNGPALRDLRRTQEALLEHLTAAIEHEYHHERERIARPADQRRAEIVQKLLAGETVDPVALAELGYELHFPWHLGVIATGARVAETLQGLKTAFGRRLLSVTRGEDTVWAWIGAQRRPVVADVERVLSSHQAPGVALAIGGPARGIDGWRQTHQEAQGARLLALRRPQQLVRYANGPLLAAALQNDTLARWLRDLLTPLGSRADGGAGLLQALRAYIDAECNRSSAASALRISRHTVESRLRTIEQLLERPLRTCLPELDVALRLEELESGALEDPSP
jgi:PucR C-terminal helix-turn-helix domain/GGDEF-like domain